MSLSKGRNPPNRHPSSCFPSLTMRQAGAWAGAWAGAGTTGDVSRGLEDRGEDRGEREGR